MKTYFFEKEGLQLEREAMINEPFSVLDPDGIHPQAWKAREIGLGEGHLIPKEVIIQVSTHLLIPKAEIEGHSAFLRTLTELI